MKRSAILVRARWDDEAEVWVATTDDVPGLVTEAATQEELMNKLQVMIPELLEENDLFGDMDEVPLVLMSEQLSRVRVRA